MSEIDDKYLEFAEALEPVGQGKHHKGVSWPFMTVAGILLLLLFLMSSSARKSPPEPKTVTVTVSVGSEERVYTGEEQIVTPQFRYTANEDGSDVTDAVSVALGPDTDLRAKDAGTYPFGLTGDSFDITAEGYDEFSVIVLDGTLTIEPAEITAAVTGNTLTAVYDRSAHIAHGYTVTASDSNYGQTDILFRGDSTAERTDTGTTYMGLSPEQFTNRNPNYVVTFSVTDGYVRIDRAAVNVTITGSTGTFVYDGAAHTVTSYTAVIDNRNYTAGMFRFSGSASATRTEIGTTPMGLSSAQFTNLNSNFSVRFNVTDGFVQITEPPRTPPVLNLIDVEDNVNLDMIMFTTATFKFTPNDLAKPGGYLKARIFYDNGSGSFVPDNEYDCSYTGDGNHTEQYLTAIHRMPELMGLVRQKGKLVIDYTYPDGTTGRYESGEFMMYKGSFIHANDAYGDRGALINGDKLEVDLIFEEYVEFENGGSMTISPENVVISDYLYGYVSVFEGGGGDYVESLSHEKEVPDEITYYRDGSGVLHMHLIYNFGEELVPTGYYDVYPGYYGYVKDTASGWDAVAW